MVQGRGLIVGEFVADGCGEDLAQLDPPLVEGVDIPDGTLGEYLVLVDGDESAEHARIESVQQQRRCRLVAFADPLWDLFLR
jgi:hypothetical protein